MPKDGTPPQDLITAKEASVMAGKSVATIRGWVRKKKITGFKEDENNHSSPLMISTQELKAYLHTGAKLTHPKNTGRPHTPSVSIQEKEREISELRNELSILKTQNEANLQRLSDLQSFISTLKELLDQKDHEVKGLREQVKLSSERETKAIEEVHQVLKWASLPFWKRWNKDFRLLNG
tara:strand:- start:2309 stop:2845 length:537 start_codon:yes stop_codon:yes gene_type:complete